VAAHRARKKAEAPGNGATPGTIPPATVPAVGSQPVPAPVPSVVVPWTTDIVQPLFDEIIPLIEEADVESLKVRAAKVDKCLVALVEKHGRWSPTGRACLIKAGPLVVCKWMNKFGVSSEYAPEIQLVGGIVAILTSRSMLISKLDEMALKMEKEKSNAPKKETAA
jgi:hypothetical protein